MSKVLNILIVRGGRVERTCRIISGGIEGRIDDQLLLNRCNTTTWTAAAAAAAAADPPLTSVEG